MKNSLCSLWHLSFGALSRFSQWERLKTVTFLFLLCQPITAGPGVAKGSTSLAEEWLKSWLGAGTNHSEIRHS